VHDTADGGAALPEQLGDFRILSLLGEGGSGVVYAARWGHREVALKVLRADEVPTDSIRKKFLAEAKVLAGIEHPSVVKVLSFGELPDGRPYLAMEKLDGESLAARVARGPLPLEEALAVFEQVARAVSALHERGLIHRDLKPENVSLVAGGEYAVLLDFGIAKDVDAVASTVTQDGLVRGTPAYMAPERFFGASASVTSDIYELAVTLFAMLTGRLPWDSADDPDARLNPARPSDVGVRLPGALEPELLRALSTRPESRPASVDEFLRSVLESQDDAATIAARATMDIRSRPADEAPMPLPTTETVQQPSRRRSLAIAGVGIAVGVAGLVSAAIVGLSSSDEAPADATDEVVEPAPEPEPEPTPGPTPTLVPKRELEPIDPNRPDGPVPDTVWRFHSKDTNVLVGLAWGKLVKSAMYGEFRKTLDLKELGAFSEVLEEECGFDPLDSMEWLTMAIPKDSFTQFEIASGGAWSREPFERCIGALVEWSDEKVQFEKAGSHTRFKFRNEAAMIGWPRSNVLLFTNRGDANRGWMDKRVAGLESTRSNKPLAALRKEISPDATFWIVAADASWMDLDSLGADVPHPGAMYASLTLGNDMTLDVGWRYDSTVQAAAATKAMQASLEKLKKSAFVSFILSEAEVKSRGKDVLIHIYTDEKSTRLIGQAMGSTFTDSFKNFPL
jgi:serine/threonine-protein kinase